MTKPRSTRWWTHGPVVRPQPIASRRPAPDRGACIGTPWESCAQKTLARAGIPARAKVFWAHDSQGVPMQAPRSGAGRRLAIGWGRTTGPWVHHRVDRGFVISRYLADVFHRLFLSPASELLV